MKKGAHGNIRKLIVSHVLFCIKVPSNAGVSFTVSHIRTVSLYVASCHQAVKELPHPEWVHTNGRDGLVRLFIICTNAQKVALYFCLFEMTSILEHNV